MITELEKLCNPIFKCICNYWQFSCISNMVDRGKFMQKILELLKEAEDKARTNPRLEREFAWIERPLVFFVDYIVKEGRFPFKDEWWELSRNYNELSGDEKFFDLLNETLEHPDFQNSFILFYVMLGLGFDGAFGNNKKYIEQCMRLCMEKAVVDFDIYSEPILPPAQKKHFFLRQRKLTVRTALIASTVFMLVCFIINIFVFSSTTENYRELLKRTAADSIPRTYYNPERGGSR
jgi:type VI protein secretion system component VasF